MALRRVYQLFKFILREWWEDNVVKVVKESLDKANNNPSFKLSSPTRQDIMNWFHRRYVFLQESKAIIQRFNVPLKYVA